MLIITTLALAGLGVATWREFQRSEKKKKIVHKKKKKKIIKNNLLTNLEEMKHYQKSSLINLGLVGVGTLFYSPINFIAIPLFIYNYLFFLKKTYQTIFVKKRVLLGVFEFTSVAGLLAMNYYSLAAFSFLMHFTAMKLVLETERETQADFSKIFASLPKNVWLLKESIEIEVPIEKIRTDDIIVVSSGEVIPVDGIIIKGKCSIDQSMLTGESKPIEKSIKDEVFASTILLSGRVNIRVKNMGQESVTGQIVKILENAVNYKAHVQSKADKIVDKGAGVIVGSIAVVSPFIGFVNALPLTFSGFGYQMRLSAPLIVLNYLKIASKNGILIKDGRALEKLLEIDVVIFDKTGTLTQNVPEVYQVISCSHYKSKKLLQFAASAENRQHHPIANAIVKEAKEQKIENLKIKDSSYEMGYGISAVLEDTKDKKILLGSEKFMNLSDIKIPFKIKDIQEQSLSKGSSLVYIANSDNKKLLGVIELSNQIRGEAFETIKMLHKLNKELYVISGDHEEPTKHLARYLNIENYYAQTLPQDKSKIVERLQKEGKKVCFVGDGINDSVALQKADVSISLNGATTIAIDVADIVLIKPDLSLLPDLFKMSKELNSRIDNSMKLNNISSISCATSIIFLGMGYSGAVLFYYSSLGANIGYSMYPLIEKNKNSIRSLVSKKLK